MNDPKALVIARLEITEQEILFAMSILEAPGGDDAEEQTLRQLRRDGSSDDRARKVLRLAIDRLSVT